MSGWFPIETAPKDGEGILAWGFMLGHIVVEFDESAADPDFPWATLDGPHYFKAAFTHWRPLPSPPPEPVSP